MEKENTKEYIFLFWSQTNKHVVCHTNAKKTLMNTFYH